MSEQKWRRENRVECEPLKDGNTRVIIQLEERKTRAFFGTPPLGWYLVSFTTVTSHHGNAR